MHPSRICHCVLTFLSGLHFRFGVCFLVFSLLAYSILQNHPISCNGFANPTLHPVPARAWETYQDTWVEFHEYKNGLLFSGAEKEGEEREKRETSKEQREKRREKEGDSQWHNNDTIAMTPRGKKIIYLICITISVTNNLFVWLIDELLIPSICCWNPKHEKSSNYVRAS